MDLNTERVPESASRYEAAPPPIADDEARRELHAEINARRAQIENAEMLRRLRSL